jgi:hypothetical protein
MYFQMCIKGINGINPADAQAILSGRGLACNWWREAREIRPGEIAARLTADEIYLHVNRYKHRHPSRTGFVWQETPFISLTAGAVERKAFEQENKVHPAHETALNFASDFGRLRGTCFLFYCWVMVGLRPCPEVRQLAEEVRELNTYRSYSEFQREGEILAKIEVPACQVLMYEQYEFTEKPGGGPDMALVDTKVNPDYVEPHSITNFRDCI